MPIIFDATVYSKDYTYSDYTLTALRKPPSLTIIVIRIELTIFYQNVTPASFNPKK